MRALSTDGFISYENNDLFHTVKKIVANFVRKAVSITKQLTYSILWQGDPFSCSKTFGKLACKLCQKERVALLRHSWLDGVNMLSDRSEIHGSCRHTARFHRLCMRSGTDDPS
jgi:hypothetical protein